MQIDGCRIVTTTREDSRRAWASGRRLRRPAAARLLLAAGMSLFGAFVVAAGNADAAEYYVAPNGSDTNPGSMTQPFATLQKGHDVAVAGDTVWLRAGTYQISRQVRLSKSGRSDTQRINFWAYQGETPVLDCSQYVPTNRGADVPAVLVTGSWLHLRGLEIANVLAGPSGSHSISTVRSEGASNNIFELLNIHHGFGPGLFISFGNGGHLILNCDSHDNYDKNGSQGDGQNGDGFGVHYQTTGPSTIIRGCRAWINSDDGYDFISQDVPVTLENSWAVMNGYANGGAFSPSSGNGNGFKAGSSDKGVRHILQNDVAWKNKAAGFYANHSSGGNTWLNNTSYMNGVQYNMLASPPGAPGTTITLSGALAHRMRNNIGFPNRNTNMAGVDSMFNTWDLNILEVSGDFVSIMDTGYAGPRQGDGSPPAIDFLKLRAGSPLIDKGTDVGLPFVGAAPDLGAYEFGATPPVGTGGASGGGTGGGCGCGGASPDGGAADGSMGSGGRLARGTGGAPGSGGDGIFGTGGNGFDGTGGTSTGSGGGSGQMQMQTDGGSSRTGGAGVVQLTGSGALQGGCACAFMEAGVPSKSGAGIAGLFLIAVACAGLRRPARSRRQRATPLPRT